MSEHWRCGVNLDRYPGPRLPLYFAADRHPLQTSDIVSKQDTHFFNTFSLVIGLLVAIVIALFVLARAVASHTQDTEKLDDAHYLKTVDQRLQPFARVAVAGADNSALAIAPTTAGPATAGPAMPKDGTELFEQACKACHGPGIGGAPKAGDHAAWAARIAEGKPTLYEHALKGFTGKSGMMPAKGGRVDVPDAIVEQAVDHMVDMAK
ncbi:MAG TPA: c-type cytochrome [Steroidobacteraceae bacterium]|nr:c-type cytochrome [Steroidobacteraceae bacterium]